MRRIFVRIHRILTLRCDEASYLTPESLDWKLSLHERWAQRLHIAGCYSCRHFARQLQLVRNDCARIGHSEGLGVGARPLS